MTNQPTLKYCFSIPDRKNRSSIRSSAETFSSFGESSISTSMVKSIVEKLQMQKNRTSTQRNYYKTWTKFNEFFIKLDVKPETWEERIVLFVGYLIDLQRKSSTIKSYVSAIKAVLWDNGQPIDENVSLLKALMRACRYQNDTVITRLPIRKCLLQMLLDKLPTIFDAPQPYLCSMYKALFTTAYFGLFRVGELTSSIHIVKAKDVHIGRNKDKWVFILHTSKTHWTDSKPQIIKITSTNSVSADDNRFRSQGSKQSRHQLEFCPFGIIKTYLSYRKKQRRNNMEQFFIFHDRSPVTPYHFRSTLWKVLLTAGVDPSFYDTKSFRSGCAVDLLDLGLSLESVKKIGWWKSNAVFTYL